MSEAKGPIQESFYQEPAALFFEQGSLTYLEIDW